MLHFISTHCLYKRKFLQIIIEQITSPNYRCRLTNNVIHRFQLIETITHLGYFSELEPTYNFITALLLEKRSNVTKLMSPFVFEKQWTISQH